VNECPTCDCLARMPVNSARVVNGCRPEPSTRSPTNSQVLLSASPSPRTRKKKSQKNPCEKVDWVCPHCTLLNSKNSFRCKACKSIKPSTTRQLLPQPRSDNPTSAETRCPETAASTTAVSPDGSSAKAPTASQLLAPPASCSSKTDPIYFPPMQSSSAVQSSSLNENVSQFSTPTMTNVLLSNELPDYIPLSATPYTWGSQGADSFTCLVTQAYEEIVHWKKNLFVVPRGHAGEDFVRETARLFNEFSIGSPLEGVSLKCIAIMSHLLLQKPHRKSKTKEDIQHLTRRLQLWRQG
jgi:hypothetical protein